MSRHARQTGDDEVGGLRARLARLAGDDPRARADAVRVVTGVALLCGLALSPRLWFPAGRTFPRAPLVEVLPAVAVTPVEYVAAVLLVAALAALVCARRPGRFSTPVVILLGLFVLLDQTRLQPWVYQYALLLCVVALRGRDARAGGPTLAALRLVVASLYFWSGAQKLNYSFGADVLPQLLAPLAPAAALAQGPWSALGVAVAGVEMFAGVGLLCGRTRRLSVFLALGLHAAVLGLLVLRAHNSVVWAWNVALMLLVVILFRRGDASSGREPAALWSGSAPARAALLLGVACALLPALSFRGWWDAYLSGALYSGNTAVAVWRVDAAAEGRLPEAARRQVFTTKAGERMLPAFGWSMSELNVPPYPEPRVFKRLTREVCVTAGAAAAVELIMKDRPAILDGSYRVVRMSCSQDKGREP